MNALKNRFFQFFFDFLTAPGLPKSSQNLKKSQKNTKKSMLKKDTFFNTIFSRFFAVLASENDSKIEDFSMLFRKPRFCKNRFFLKENCYFSGFEPPKIYEKSMPNHTRKKHRKKNSQTSISASLLVSQNPPRSTQHRKKSKKKAFEKKHKKTTSAIHITTTGNQAFWDPAGPSNHHSND